MVYKPFFITVVSLAVALALIPIAAVWVWLHAYMVVTKVALILLWPATLVYLIYHINRTNRELSKFLESFRHHDSTIVFNDQLPLSFQSLQGNFNEIINAFKEVAIEKEKGSIFFQRTIEHSGTGLLAINDQNKILLCNTALLKLLQLPSLSRVETLQKQFPELYSLLLGSKAGHQQLYSLIVRGELKKIVIKATIFKSDDDTVKLLSLQDIRNEVDEAELDAWKKLIKVLRHEIHNSVSPITLLSSGLAKLYENEGKPVNPMDVTIETIEDTRKGLQTIHKRSKGLSAFVDQYRNLTQLPKPTFIPVEIDQLLAQMIPLAESMMTGRKIPITQSGPSGLIVLADEKLIEQVILNILKNAIEAIEDRTDGEIAIRIAEIPDSITISISDNGKGIDETDLDQIFTPFFTTKQDGSGIGLSLSRQIMRMHGGNLTATTQEGISTTFTLNF